MMGGKPNGKAEEPTHPPLPKDGEPLSPDWDKLIDDVIAETEEDE